MTELQQLEQRLTELTGQWMQTIRRQHHKDRDCHFVVERRLSYGDKPYWSAEHFGYWIERPFSKRCKTYREAVGALIALLTEEIAEAKRCIEERDK